MVYRRIKLRVWSGWIMSVVIYRFRSIITVLCWIVIRDSLPSRNVSHSTPCQF
jgi:hypothetical protein